MISILFVCLGNICRSTMAEAVMRHMVDEAGLSHKITVDSAGTASYHVGEPPHQGTRRILDSHEISWQGISGRKITTADLEKHSYIIAMDENNLRDIQSMATNGQAEKLHLLSEFSEKSWPCGHGVPDPWYTGNFEETFDLVSQGCRGLLRVVTGK